MRMHAAGGAQRDPGRCHFLRARSRGQREVGRSLCGSASGRSSSGSTVLCYSRRWHRRCLFGWFAIIVVNIIIVVVAVVDDDDDDDDDDFVALLTYSLCGCIRLKYLLSFICLPDCDLVYAPTVVFVAMLQMR